MGKSLLVNQANKHTTVDKTSLLNGRSISSFYIQYFLLFAAFCLISAFIIYFSFPHYIYFVIEDDHLVESLSAFFFLSASILAFRILIIYKRWWRFTLFVALFGVIGFLDELSFGERIFDLDMPVFMGVKIDAAHDFVAIAYIIFKDLFGLVGLLSIIIGSFIVLCAVFAYQQKYTLHDLTGGIHKTLPGYFLILFLFFLITATIIDLKEDMVPLVIIEELFEMYAGLALCFYSVSLSKQDEPTGQQMPNPGHGCSSS